MAKSVHGEKYDYSQVQYKGNKREFSIFSPCNISAALKNIIVPLFETAKNKSLVLKTVLLYIIIRMRILKEKMFSTTFMNYLRILLRILKF
jgi:hypothetical protein